MGFKKVLQSDHAIVISSSENDDKRFPPGFCYRIGGVIYTVKKDVTQEQSSPMREVILSDGKIEIIPIESIQKDLKESDCEILEPDEKFMPKPPVEVKKKTVKKKKKTKKVSKKND